MKILITGGAGYIGSVLIESLIDGHEIFVLDNLTTGHRDSVPEKAIFYYGDCHDLSTVGNVVRTFKPELIIHLASNALVAESITNEKGYTYDNVLATLCVAYMCKRFNIKLIFASTCGIFKAADNLIESSPVEPINPYAESKLISEYLIKRLVKESIIVRFFNVGGATEKNGERHFPETHLIPIILQDPFIIVNGDDHPTPDGTCIRDYLHVVDIVSFIKLAIDNFIPGEYNLGTNRGYSIFEIIQLCAEVMGAVNWKVGPRREGDPAILVANNSLAFKAYNWRPKKSIQDIIGDTQKWLAK